MVERRSATLPVTAWIAALVTEATSVFLEGEEPWGDQCLNEHAYYLALTHSLEELAERAKVFIDLAAVSDEVVQAHRAADDEKP